MVIILQALHANGKHIQVSLKHLETYFLNQLFAVRDEILYEHKMFC